MSSDIIEHERKLVKSIVSMGYAMIQADRAHYGEFVRRAHENGMDVEEYGPHRLRVLFNYDGGRDDFQTWQIAKLRYAQIDPEGAFRMFNNRGDRPALEAMMNLECMDPQMVRNCEMALRQPIKVGPGFSPAIYSSVEPVDYGRLEAIHFRKPIPEDDSSFQNAVRSLEETNTSEQNSYLGRA